MKEIFVVVKKLKHSYDLYHIHLKYMKSRIPFTLYAHQVIIIYDEIFCEHNYKLSSYAQLVNHTSNGLFYAM